MLRRQVLYAGCLLALLLGLSGCVTTGEPFPEEDGVPPPWEYGEDKIDGLPTVECKAIYQPSINLRAAPDITAAANRSIPELRAHQEAVRARTDIDGEEKSRLITAERVRVMDREQAGFKAVLRQQVVRAQGANSCTYERRSGKKKKCDWVCIGHDYVRFSPMQDSQGGWRCSDKSTKSRCEQNYPGNPGKGTFFRLTPVRQVGSPRVTLGAWLERGSKGRSGLYIWENYTYTEAGLVVESKRLRNQLWGIVAPALE